MKLILGFVLTMFLGVVSAQDDEYPYPPLSAKGSIIQEVGFTIIKIEYERPSARNRKIFGELVPWNKVWRNGAGFCTKIGFDRTTRIGGQTLPAGKYAMLSIPNEDEWIIILNSDTTLYGSRDYNADLDVARFTVPVTESSRFYETFTIDIDVIPNDARCYMSWGKTQVSFNIETFTDKMVDDYISKNIETSQPVDPNFYIGAASYYYYQNKNLLQALTFAQKGIEKGGNKGWAYNERIAIFDKLHMYEEALDEIDLQLAYIDKDKYEKEENREREKKRQKDKAKRILQKMKSSDFLPLNLS